MLQKNIGSTEQKTKVTKNLIEKYIDEVYLTGINHQILEEGKKISNNLLSLVKQDRFLGTLLDQYENEASIFKGHLFLTTILSVVTCQTLDWRSERTINTITISAMFHDIGKIKLPLDLREKPVELMEKHELTLYRKHTAYGVELLSGNPLITEAIRQVVYQHHEYTDGSGFPNGLSGLKIYPPAKVVGLCSEFATFLIQNKISPLEGVKKFFGLTGNIAKFEASVLRAFLKNFQQDKRALT
jgi:HD-GYP domain-containing protein (c-di-GMP phosphodiesterase class II)